MLIVCPNIAIDHTVTLPRLYAGAVQRTGPAASAAGGKGANMARAARALGGDPQVLAFVAAGGGDYLRELFAAEQLPLVGIDVPGAVRTCTVLIEDSGRVTLLNEPGASVDERGWQALLSAVDPAATRVIGTGSLPPGAPADGYARLVELVHARGGECAVDSGGLPLRLAAQAGADLVCPNLSEAQAVLTGAVDAVEQVDERADDIAGRAVEAAQQLVALGAGQAAVTAGAAGVAVAGTGLPAWLPTVPVAARNPIGAGDSFLAGTVLARERGADWIDAVRFGMAVAASSVENHGSGVVDPVRVTELEAALAQAHRG
ncbi:1-phosphofructokinase family hexose kinase [Nakamurella lactea]|uniref:1-phosphofructokinase family hexose kinase n=1 Tax=Nakamurella lactea TaxID=459515 RepID=UPI000401B649|nr:PfkB family carbohydrate kinase [Nakamurella lactea]